jgi:hypothetical protein
MALNAFFLKSMFCENIVSDSTQKQIFSEAIVPFFMHGYTWPKKGEFETILNGKKLINNHNDATVLFSCKN